VPCGIEGVRMTSICRELGAEQDLAAFGRTLAERLGAELRREPEPMAVAELTRLVPDAALEAEARAAVA
jgi:hypothetical protein